MLMFFSGLICGILLVVLPVVYFLSKFEMWR